MPSETNPLSADVYAIRGETVWWIFDVGASDEAADFINNLPCDGVVPGTAPLKKNIVISHFHRDHFFNLPRVHFDNLYVGRETFRHCDETIRALGTRGRSQSSSSSVTVVESPLQFEDGIRVKIMPIPNSHAKGSLIFIVGDAPAQDAADATSRGARDSIAFLGDSTYPTVGHNGPDSYNAQLLLEQIRFLKSLDAKSFIMSHRRFLPREKDTVIQFLEGIYEHRKLGENLIFEF